MTKRAPLSFKVDRVAPATETQTGLPENVQTTKRAKEQTRKGRDGQKFIAAHVSPEARKQFTLLAVQQDSNTQDMLIEAINDLFAKYKLSRIA